MARRHQETGELAYTILLIITDGIINDMEQTKAAIVSASLLPLSIIIVGVGDADFSNMRELDSDDGPLMDNRGRRAKRDIVQFVKFKDFELAPPGRLSKETLEEVPGQMMAYVACLRDLNEARKRVKEREGVKKRKENAMAVESQVCCNVPESAT